MLWTWTGCGLANIFLLLIGWTSCLSHHTLIPTKYGTLQGVKLQFSSSSSRHLDPVTSYLGIPYASPPINAYRFMPPVAPLPWTGTRQAVNLPPACPQKYPDVSNRTKALEKMTLQRYLFLQKLIPHLANQSEDCLYLNLYVPTTGDEMRPGKFAILFVIHGESWEWGSGNEFDGGVLASLGNHIVVTFNYRLGILGFLKTSNQQSNFGLLDVIAALHWVRENTDTFGGDRNRITLLGYRTGAVVANLLLVAQIAKGLFQRAILISGSVLSPWALQRSPEDVALQVSKHLNCVGRLPLSHPESDLAPCLRRKHLSDLLNYVPDTPRFLSPFAPYVDGRIFRQPKNQMEGDAGNEQFLTSQLLIIFATGEGANELNEFELRNGFESDHRDRILRTLVRNVFSFHQHEIFSIVRNEYTDWDRPMLHPIPLKDATVEALSDCLVVGPAIQVARIHSRGKGTTFLMHFSHLSRDTGSDAHERFGSLEVVPYAMGLPVTNNVPALGGQQYISPWSTLANFSKQDVFVSETIVHYMANFAKTGDPNSNEVSRMGNSFVGGGRGNSDGGEWASLSSSSGSSHEQRTRIRSLHWEPFEPGSQFYISLQGTKTRTRSHYRGHKMALWLSLIPQIHLPGGPDVTLSHHTFQDDNPNLYIGPVRPLLPYKRGTVDSVTTKTQQSGQSGSQSTSQGIYLTTSECLESTETSFTQGTHHNIVIDSNEVEVEIRGGGGGGRSFNIQQSKVGSMGSGEYDYTTALTVTLTVGVCLILLNLLVFSAIMCHRKRGLTVNLSESPGGRRNTGSTHLKAPYQEEYQWSSCCSSSMKPDYGEETMAMNQYPAAAIAHLDLPKKTPSPSSIYNSAMRSPRSPSPLMAMSPVHVDYGNNYPQCHSQGGTLTRVNIPDCVHGAMPTDSGGDVPIRLYLNHGAGEGNLPDISSNLSTSGKSSSGGGDPTTTTTTTTSPCTPGSTLVGVLKRQTTTPTSTSIKKRVQIQEISV